MHVLCTMEKEEKTERVDEGECSNRCLYLVNWQRVLKRKRKALEERKR